jgi:AcrR family transcriptional regulator
MPEPRTPRPLDLPEPGVIAGWEPGRRGEILDAALGVFAEKGYSAGSMRDIAARVGVTEPALYRHFPGKEALFLALVRVVAGHLRDDAFALLDGIRPDTLREQVAAALADRRRAVTFFSPVLRTLITTAAHNPAVLEEIRNLVVVPAQARLTAKVEELDTAYGVESDAASRQARVRSFLSLFAGSLATSVVLGDQPDAATADAVVRLMGWEGKA